MSRRRLGGVLAALAASAGCGSSAARTPLPSGGPSGMPLRYGGHPSQHAELTLPADDGPAAVVVVLHGGFWRTGYGAELGRPLAADLVAAGWATLNVEYRRVGTAAETGGGGWPRTAEDVAAAVDLLADEGQRRAGGRLDLDRVLGLGHSAGGHLAAWLAARPGLPSGAPGADPVVRLRGAVLQAGVLDLVAAARAGLGGTAVTDLMGGTPDERPDDYALASPQARLPLGVPTVCVHGDVDAIVPPAQSADFVAAARAAGDRSDLRTFAGDHFAPITVGTPAWQLCRDALDGLVA